MDKANVSYQTETGRLISFRVSLEMLLENGEVTRLIVATLVNN